MSNEPLENEPFMVSLDGDISSLSAIAIQMHEVYLELKKAGFTASESTTIAGMLMSSFVSPDSYYSINEDEYEEFLDDDGEIQDSMEYLDPEDDEEDF